ncbi:YadA-like family protein [Glacieibacterium frigidum]|uniref:Autotransporter adhesin n=1 Tax=Glacieibacterium frigidum TaxID=2593303 RepID=A0A552UF79_9SPHN|nr:YadA-like family protein [Glacieibacterium frigidum]TRW16875.1 hypothetical protein FMM06_01305 [Glacieibacterium frigidum]
MTVATARARRAFVLLNSAATALATALIATPAQAALVGACTGVSLPRSVVTDIVAGPLNGIVNPLQGRVNDILGVVGIIPIVGEVFPQLSIDVAGLLNNAASGAPITLQALDVNGVIVGPADNCQSTADSFQLDTPAGISIGGNRILGLGSEGLVANAGEIGSIALGNTASTTAAATNAVAIGTGASVTAANSVAVGAGSTATRGAVAGYTAPGLAAPQTSAGEFSVGAAGATRQITNVAAGSAPTDAVNVAQVSAAIGATAAAQPIQYSTPGAPTTPNPGVTSNDVTLVGTAPGTAVALHNVAPGVVASGSTDAVNGGQLFTTNTNVTNNTTNITNLNNGLAGLVQQAGGSPGAGAISVGAATAGTVVNFTGTGGTRTLTGVTAGALAPGSTDAVNGSQLSATNTQVTNTTNALAVTNNNVTNLTTGINTGTIGLVRQVGGSPGAGLITVGAETGGTNVSVAGTDGNRIVSGVAAGVAPTDAVNVSQLTAMGGGVANAVQYDVIGGLRTNTVTLTGGAAGPVTITNLAPGALTATSTDAVNGSQLSATNTQVTAINTQVTTNTAAIAVTNTNVTNLTTGINNGTIGLVQQTGGAPGAGQITVGQATGGTSVSVAGTDGNRVVSGVAAGVAATDAVNVSQLNAVGNGVANAVQYDVVGGVRTNTVTLAGGAAGPVTVTNVAAGALNDTSTDAVNGAQLFATNSQVTTNTTNIANLTTTVAGNTTAITANTTAITNLTNGTAGLVQQDGGAPGAGTIRVGASTAGTTVDVTGTGGTRTVTGVTAGALNDTSTDAVNGAQLFATNSQTTINTTNIAGNTTAITNLTTNINNGTVGLVQQTGGSPGNGPITVGATTGGTTINVAGTGGDRIITGVAPGLAANDAATVGQLAQVTGGAFNAVQYDTDANGGRLNSVTLIGGSAGPVTISNVAAGALTAGSTDAVNGSQLAAANAQIVTNSTTINNIIAGNAGAFRSNNAAGAPAASATGANASAGGFGATASGVQSVALGNGAVSTGSRSVALGAQSTDGGVANVVSVGSVGAERRIVNVGPAINGTDAVNLSQLQAATGTINSSINNLQGQIDGLGFDLRNARRRANAGTAGAMAVAALPQPFTEGAGMVAGAVGFWQDQVAFAIGVSKIVSDSAIVKAGASVSGRGSGGFNAGVGFQF